VEVEVEEENVHYLVKVLLEVERQMEMKDLFSFGK